MALSREQYDIILAGRDLTTPAFASAQRNTAVLRAQVTQLTAAFRLMGATGAAANASALGGIVTSFARGGPLMLGITAVTLAAEYFWRTFREEAPSAERDLREHNRILGDIKSSYRDAAAQASAFYQQRRAILLLEAQANVAARQQALQEAQAGISPNVTQFELPLMPRFLRESAREGQQVLAGVVDQLRASGDLRGYIDALSALRTEAEGTNPVLAGQAAELLNAANAALSAAEALEMAEAGLAALQGTATQSQLALLGLGETAKKSASERVPAHERVIAALELERDNLSRTAVEQRVYNELARAGVEINGAAGQAIRDLVVDIEAQRSALERAREQAQYFGDSILSSLDTLISRSGKAIDVVRNLALQLGRAALQAALLGQGPLAGFLGLAPTGGSAFGGVFGALFGGGDPWAGIVPGRQQGGAVAAGQLFETHGLGRREFFIPSRDGEIVPETQMGTTRGKVIRVHAPVTVVTQDAPSFTHSRGQISRTIGLSMQRAARFM